MNESRVLDILTHAESVKVARLQPGDLLVLKAAGLLSLESKDQLRADLKRILEQSGVAGVTVVVLDRASELEIVRGERAQQA